MLHAPASCNTAHRVFSCNKQKRGPQYILCSQLEMSAALDDVCDTTAHPTQLPARTGTPDSAPVLPYLSGAAPPPGTRSAARSACTRRQKDASSLRVLVLIGVACAFCAAFNPRMTKVASKLPEANCPISVTPRWLPVLLASTKSPGSGEISPPSPPPEVCGACTVDYSFAGVPFCCDAAWTYNWTCAELSTWPTLRWDCSGCSCPGDPSPPPPSPSPLISQKGV